MKPIGYMVMFNDEAGICVPYGPDPNTEGAIETNDRPVLFTSRADARRAIAISTAAARLAQAQGKPVNTDFTESKKYIKIVPVTMAGNV